MKRRFLILLATFGIASCGGAKSATNPGNDVTFTPPSGTLLPVAQIGSAYTQQIQVANGGTQPFVFTLTSGPPGLSLAAVDSLTTNLQGTPTAQGQTFVQISVNDALNHTTFLSYQFRVNAGGNSNLSITPTTIPNAVRPQTYTQFFNCVNGVAPFTWTQTGSLPQNLIFVPTSGSSCEIEGVPVVTGTFSFTLSVTDSSNPPNTGTATISLTVN
jgi:hypothetical protein